MAKRISGSVGKGGKNQPEDTLAVQELLNTFASKCGFKKLDTDGLIGPKTISAIASFQKKAVGMSRPDSRVDPRGKSLQTLNMGPKKAESEAKKAEKKEKKKQEEEEKQSAGKPQVKGDTRGVDKKLLGLLEAVSAHYNKPIVIATGKQKPMSSSGDEVWRDWAAKLKHGKRDPNLSRDERLRRQLDDLYNDLQKDAFLDLLAKEVKKSKSKGSDSAHAAGRAVDLKKNTDSKVVAALSTILRREDEGSVIHFDDAGKSLPKTITDDMKKKWK